MQHTATEFTTPELLGFTSAEGPFEEAEEMELAAQLLEVTDESELDRFIGNLMRRATQGLGRVISSPVGRALGGVLKGVAKKALPVLGGVVGGYFGGPIGAQVGSRLAAKAGSLFGLELEGLSPEDQEYEVARRFVRFAGAAARQAALAPKGRTPQDIARGAASDAARQHAPGLIPSAPQTAGPIPGIADGRWVRRGRNIIIVNC